MKKARLSRSTSLRRTLLIGILAPIALFIVINSVSLYRQSLVAATTAYDRTLLASAKTIGEELDVQGYDEQARLRATVPYAALEAFEADNQSRMYYRVSTLDGALISGFDELVSDRAPPAEIAATLQEVGARLTIAVHRGGSPDELEE